MSFLNITQIYEDSVSAFSQVTPGVGTINGIPLFWDVDIYAYLEKNGSLSDLNKTAIHYFEVASQKVKFPEIKKDQSDYQSTDRTISVTSLNSKQISIKPSGQLASPGDVVNMAYNQKLKLYIPSTGQYVWIGPKKKDGFQILSVTKVASESDLTKIKQLETEKITHTSPPTQQKSKANAAQVQ